MTRTAACVVFVENTELEQTVRVRATLKRIVGLGPRVRVTGVEDTPDGVVVDVALDRRRRPICPCGWFRGHVHGRRTRRWRHLDACGLRVWLRAEVRRLACHGCGRVRTEQVPFARPAARHTTAFEDLTAWLVQRTDKTAVAAVQRISWATVGTIAARVVADRLPAGRLDGLVRIGVDEISYRKHHRYLTVVVDHVSGGVVWVGRGKGKATLLQFFDELGEARSAQIEAISMDMGRAYAAAAAERIPQAVVCLDPFHVMGWAGEELDTALRRVADAKDGLQLRGRARTRLRHTLRRGAETLTDDQRAAVDRLRDARHELFAVWELKERLRDVYRVPPDQAAAHLHDWYRAVGLARIEEMNRLAARLLPHTEGIIAAAELRLSNSRVESANGRIRLIHRRGFGYHTAEAMAALIYLCCSGMTIDIPTRT